MTKKQRTVDENFSAIWMDDFTEIIDDAINFEKQVQINGFDLTVKEIFSFKGEGAIDFDNSKRVLPEYESLELKDNEYWQLEAGAYIIRYNEIVSVPLNTVGIIQSRSTILRMGAMMVGAWWDSGYSGRGQGLLVAYRPIRVYKNARIAQIVFILTKKVGKGYSGKYQDEAK